MCGIGLDAITAAHDGDIQMVDSTSIRAHQQAATAKRGIEIIVSVDHAAGSRPKSMLSSMRKGSRSGSACPLGRRMMGRPLTNCSTISGLT